MHNQLSRLDYLDGLGTLSERAAYRVQLEQDHIAREREHIGFVILRRTLTAISAVVVIATVTLALVAIGSFIAGVSWEPDARPGVHIPCLVSLPHCDEPANGIWSTR